MKFLIRKYKGDNMSLSLNKGTHFGKREASNFKNEMKQNSNHRPPFKNKILDNL